MEVLHNGYTLEISPGAFPLSTDSIALADFVRLPKSATVLDLGSGCGTLGLFLCARDEICKITGIELTEAAHQTALCNIENNKLTDRLTSICADLRNFSTVLQPGSFSCCVSNPPYFTDGPQSKTLPLARREDVCTMQDLMAAAAWALKYGGDFFLVHRPERLAELIVCAGRHNLEAKRLRLLRHRKDGEVSLVLVQLRKGGKPGLIWEEESLYDAKGEPTEYFKKLYHL